jgi:hypothetical protein
VPAHAAEPLNALLLDFLATRDDGG